MLSAGPGAEATEARELLAQDWDPSLAREVAQAIADATGKPLREL